MAVTMGDPSGIGAEILAQALTREKVQRALTPVVFGDGPTLEAFPQLSGFRRVPVNELVRRAGPAICAVTTLSPRDRRPGKPTVIGGAAQYQYVMQAIAAAKAGWADAICTAPVSKEQIARSGVPFTGHTELLADAWGVPVLMLMDGPRVRVALATQHLPLRKVPSALTRTRLVAQLKLLSTSLTAVLGRKPRIGVCGLNPHAGDGGILGDEEQRIIGPAIASARRAAIDCHGPFAADGLFAKAERMPFDVVLAMYHDQGLVASKALDFDLTVNVTLGLPVPRTSPDHGVAYDIAGQGRANSTPMIAALLKAAQLAKIHA